MIAIESDETCPFCGSTEIFHLIDFDEQRHRPVGAHCCYDLQEHDADGEIALWACAPFAKTLYGDIRRPVTCDLTGDQAGTYDFKPHIGAIAFRAAKNFVAEHHAHNKPPAGWRFGAGAYNGPTLMAVVMVGRPVARKIDQANVVEVNRLCVRRDVPAGWRWNICSMLYGWAAREARMRGFSQIMTYTRDDEPGISLRAAGWAQTHTTRGRQWSCPSRPRQYDTNVVNRQRWVKQLRSGRAREDQSGAQHQTGLISRNRTQ